jgi:TonB-linked SusC/RagA family outer membrane protein
MCLKTVLKFQWNCLLLVFSLSFLSISLSAQQTIKVAGRVVDNQTKAPLAGVSISVKGNNKVGAITTEDGIYSLNASSDAVLVITSLGYTDLEVPVNNQTLLNVSLNSKSTQLSDVVVIGYGTRQKKDLTGSVATTLAKDIEKSTASTPEMAMQGRMAGVLVNTPSGNPNDRVTVRIRGVNTFNGVNDPLYVIDGVPLVEGVQGTRQAVLGDLGTPNNIFSIINPNDIESISVLKDASAASIYGVRASNGVVLITTKRGKIGKPKIDASAYFGTQSSVARPLDVLNVQQYVALYKEAYANNPDIDAGNPKPFGDVFGPVFDETSPQYLGNSSFTDWQRAYLNDDAPFADVSVRLSGATEGFNYYLSTGYYKTEGTLQGSNKEKYTLSTNLSTKISKYLEVGLTSALTYDKSLNELTGSLSDGYNAPPWQPIFGNGPRGYAPVFGYLFEPNPGFDPTLVTAGPIKNLAAGYPRKLWGEESKFNDFGFMATGDNMYHTTSAVGNAYLQVNPVKGLKIKGSIGGSYIVIKNDSYTEFDRYAFNETPGNPYENVRDTLVVANLGIRNTYQKSLVKELLANYNLSFSGDHNIDITAVANEQSLNWSILSGSGGLLSTDPDVRNTLNLPLQNGGGFSTLRRWSLIGYALRASYKYANKYYLDVSVRRDGSSLLAPSKRWGNFPAVGLGWRITSEKFMQEKNIKWLNDLKIRGSWGKSGNLAGTEGFAYLSLINPGISVPNASFGSGNGNAIGNNQLGAYLPNFANTSLSWETLTATGVGFDAIMFNNKVNFTLEYYNRLNEDIIQSVNPPPSAGIEAPTDVNVATVRNRGIEISLGYNTRIGEVDFNVSGNITTINNKVVKLNGGTPWAPNVREGYSMYFLYGYKSGGIFQNQAEIDAWRAKYTDASVGQSTSNPTAGYQPKPGDAYFLDVNRAPDSKNPSAFNNSPDSIINDNDQTYLGKTVPGFFYGFNVGAAWKGFDLSAQIYGVGDVVRYNNLKAGGEAMSSIGTNQLATVLNRWTPQNPSATMTRAAFRDPNLNGRTSDRFVESGAFMRLKNLQLGYTFPKSVLNKTGFVEGLRLYVGAVNLFTITKYTGYDPENEFYPPARQVLAGVNINF